MKLTLTNSEIPAAIDAIESRIPGSSSGALKAAVQGVDLTGTVLKAKITSKDAPTLMIEIDVTA